MTNRQEKNGDDSHRPGQGKIWFVTGAGRGLGRAIAVAALERGDRVAASSRRLQDVADLSERFSASVLTLGLDVRDRAAAAQILDYLHPV